MQAKELIETVGQFDVVGSTGIDLRQAFADAVGQETVVWKMGRASAAHLPNHCLLPHSISKGLSEIYPRGSDDIKLTDRFNQFLSLHYS